MELVYCLEIICSNKGNSKVVIEDNCRLETLASFSNISPIADQVSSLPAAEFGFNYQLFFNYVHRGRIGGFCTNSSSCTQGGAPTASETTFLAPTSLLRYLFCDILVVFLCLVKEHATSVLMRDNNVLGSSNHRVLILPTMVFSVT